MSTLRAAVRSLARAKGFALAAIGILAVGIGANTAVFSVVDAILLRPLPFADDSRLFTISSVNAARGIREAPFSYPAFLEMASRDRELAGLAAIAPERFDWTGVAQPEELSGFRVSASFFDVIGVPMAAGRGFTAADDLEGAPDVAVLGRRFWMRAFNGDARALGTSIALNGRVYAVTGVLGIDVPAPFDDIDVWATHVDRISGFTRTQIDGGLGYLAAVARLTSGAAEARTQAELDTIAHGYARANPANTDADPNASFRLVPLRERAAGSVRTPLILLMAAVGLVLIVACANVANLVLVRATSRAHEAAVRVALGASRADLLRWTCSESFVVAAAGGALGVLFAFWGVSSAAAAFREMPAGFTIAVDARALVFSAVVTVATAIGFGLAPISLLSRQPLTTALRARTSSSSSSAMRTLLVAEVALSIVLLVGAGLLLGNLVRLAHVSVGFETRGLLTAHISLPTPKYANPETMRAFTARLVERLNAAPGIQRASASMAIPPTVTTMAPYVAADQPLVAIGERPVGQWTGVTPGYFATMGIALKTGRAFVEADNERAPLVVVVSEGLARRVWPNDSPVGRKLLVGRFSGFAEVVGVVGDVKNAGLAAEPVPAMYTPYAQRPWPSFSLAIRSSRSNPLTLANTVRAVVSELDADLPLTAVGTTSAALADSIQTEREIAGVLSVFALVALVMAAAGLYGVVAYTVERRTREIGVRVALGAAPASVLRMVAADGMQLTAIGLVIGTAAAIAAARVLSSRVSGFSAGDPIVYAGVVIGFALVAGLACLMPARRALRVDPLVALRTE